MVQRRIGLRLSFIIGEDNLGYTVRDYSGERSVSVPYESIHIQKFANVKLVYTPLFINLFGCSIIFLIGGAALGAIDPSLGIPFIALASITIFSAFLCRFTPRSAFKFRVFQVSPAPPGLESRTIRIFEGRDTDKILSAIDYAFKKKVKRLYGAANLENDPKKEYARLAYLRDISVLTEDEFVLEVSKIENGSLLIPVVPTSLN